MPSAPDVQPGVGLMMIVKDEAHVIEKCLASVRPLIDWWVIADTGSTDGTQDVVRAALAGVPGELVERPWVDFGHNRQEVLDLARASAHAGADDFVLWIDADEQLLDAPATLGALDADGYYLPVEFAGTAYDRLALVRLHAPWRWVGPIHEYLDLPGATTGRLDAPTVHVEHTGARSLDPETYVKDAALIERALADTPDDPRLQFYLAQSRRDAGHLEAALEAYRRRVDNPTGWDQERWHARLQVAVLLERLGHPPADVAAAYLDAHQACPWRAEPLVELARHERQLDRFEVAVMYAREATRIPLPTAGALFVDVAAHTWRAWDELAISCYWTGRRDEGIDAARRSIAVGPDDPRLQANLDWLEQLPVS